jgi:hypothetical protein
MAWLKLGIGLHVARAADPLLPYVVDSACDVTDASIRGLVETLVPTSTDPGTPGHLNPSEQDALISGTRLALNILLLMGSEPEFVSWDPVKISKGDPAHRKTYWRPAMIGSFLERRRSDAGSSPTDSHAPHRLRAPA